ALAVFGGALGVGLGFGLQKITSNFVSGVILLLERTLRIGDLVEVGGEKGHVKYLGIRHTLIETTDGREVMVPNEELILTRVTNWTYSSTQGRGELLLTVGYGSDPQQIIDMLLAVARDNPRVMKSPAPACFLNRFAPEGLEFMLQFWVGDINEGL